MQLVTHQCPNCSGSIDVEPGQSSVRCQYCGTTISIEPESAQPAPPPPVVRPAAAATGTAKPPILKFLIPFFIFDFLAVLIIVPVVIFTSSQKKQRRITVEQKVQQDVQRTMEDIKKNFNIMGANVQIIDGMGTPLNITVNGLDLGKITADPRWEGYRKGHVEPLSGKALTALKHLLATYPMPSEGPGKATWEVIQLANYRQTFLRTLEDRRRTIMRKHRDALRWVILPRPLGSAREDMAVRALFEVLKSEPGRAVFLHRRLVREGLQGKRLNKMRKISSLLTAARVKGRDYWKRLAKRPHQNVLDALEAFYETLDLGDLEAGYIVRGKLYRLDTGASGSVLLTSLEDIVTGKR